MDSYHWCLSWANLVQVVPRCRLRSSLHLVFGLPRGLNHLRGTQDVALMVHLLSWSLATWPAHRYFDCLMWSMMSVTPVCCRIQVLCLWSQRVMPSIILSIFLCATASASIWAVVKAQVSLPYVITGSTYSLNTFFLICMLALRLLMISSTLLKATHPKVIRLLISGMVAWWWRGGSVGSMRDS